MSDDLETTAGSDRQTPGLWTMLRLSLRVVSGSNISRMAAALAYR
ncbi:hypothetical protein MNBD_PLANCTO03-1290, partial [hydrothermal vent metagenome]